MISFLAIGCSLPFEQLPKMIEFTVVQIILHTIYGMGIVVAAELLRSQTLTILLVMATAMGIIPALAA